MLAKGYKTLWHCLQGLRLPVQSTYFKVVIDIPGVPESCVSVHSACSE